MKFTIRQQKITNHIKSLACFLLAFTAALFVVQYFFIQFSDPNTPYIFALIVFVLYFMMQMLAQIIQLYIWPYIKTVFAPEQPMQLNEQTQPALQNWHAHLLQYLQDRFSVSHALVFVYDVAQQRYRPLFADGIPSLPANHALIYVAKQQHNHLIDASMISDLPEVTGLDVQLLLKQYRANQVIPIGVDRGTVCGFIFCQSRQLTQTDSENIAKQFGGILSQIIQHDAVVRPANTLAVTVPKISWPVGVAVISFIVFTAFWFIQFSFQHLVNTSRFILFFWIAFVPYGVVALWGSIWAFIAARRWQATPNISKALWFFGLGLFFQVIGQVTYTYYLFVSHATVLYPSISDIFFYSTIPLYIIALIYLARALGVRVSLQSFGSKLRTIAIPSALLLLSFAVFLQGYQFDWTNPLKVIMDFGVPLGQAIYISLALLIYTLTKGTVGGMMKSKILLILFALVIQYMADWTFLFQASRGTWYAGGVNDYMYLCAYFLMTIGLLQFKIMPNKLSEEKR